VQVTLNKNLLGADECRLEAQARAAHKGNMFVLISELLQTGRGGWKDI
jgi:hypothetical protein